MRKDWLKHEKYLMRKFGLIPQPSSGSGETFKEDGRSDKLLVQLKSTEGKSVSIKKRDVLKLINNAWVAHKIPILIFDFVSENSDFVFIVVRPFDILEVAKEFQKLKENKTEERVLNIPQNDDDYGW